MRANFVIYLAVILILSSFPSPATAQWGLVGCSTSDSASTFYWDVSSGELVFNPVIPLGIYGNYPYDAVMRPGNDEVWIAGTLGSGLLVIEWDGTGRGGHKLASGSYLVVVQAGELLAGTKVILLQ